MNSKVEISDKQEAIDDAWRLYCVAVDACDELGQALTDLSDAFDVDVSKAGETACAAYSELEEAYSTGRPILPPHSSDGGKA